MPFDSILPEQITNYDGNLILTTREESPNNCEKPILCEDIFEKHFTVIRGMMIQQLNLDFEENDLVIGIDPGQRIGFSVFYFGKEIENSFFSSIDDLVLHIIGILGSLRARKKIIKIGNGNMKIGKKIESMLNLKFCSSFELEYVDESKTSLKIKNFNQRGKRDMLSAKFISQREGYRHSILPLSLTGWKKYRFLKKSISQNLDYWKNQKYYPDEFVIMRSIISRQTDFGGIIENNEKEKLDVH